MVQRKDSNSNGAKADDNADDALAGSGNVEKIRDILFGGQMRDYDRRFEMIEQRAEAELTRTRNELTKRVDSFESYTKKELEKLTAKYLQEKKERMEAVKSIERSLKDAVKELDDKLSAMDEFMTTENADLRNEIHEGKKEILADVKNLFDELTELTRSGHDELNEVKVDRTEFSALLTEMAMRITREFELPGE